MVLYNLYVYVWFSLSSSVLFSQVLKIFNVLLLIFEQFSFVNTTEQSFTLDFSV